jgi:DNA-binding transcriptional LysR family regulator
MRYFVAVAEELHFGRAATRLHVSTPTLSQQIKVVEREVGAPLLIRHSRGVDLTPAGEVLLRQARKVLLSAEDAVRETRRAAGVAAPALRLGLLNGVPEWLPSRIGELLTVRVPGCRVLRQHEHRQRGPGAAQLKRGPQSLVAEAGRHPYVGDHDVGAMPRYGGEQGRSVVDRGDDLVPEPAEDLGSSRPRASRRAAAAASGGRRTASDTASTSAVRPRSVSTSRCPAGPVWASR